MNAAIARTERQDYIDEQRVRVMEARALLAQGEDDMGYASIVTPKDPDKRFISNREKCSECGTRDGFKKIGVAEALILKDEKHNEFYVFAAPPWMPVSSLFVKWMCYKKNHDRPNFYRRATTAQVTRFLGHEEVPAIEVEVIQRAEECDGKPMGLYLQDA